MEISIEGPLNTDTQAGELIHNPSIMSSTLGTIHLVRTQKFPKIRPPLPPCTQTYEFVYPPPCAYILFTTPLPPKSI